ncbi:hypothetical protein ACXWRS_11470, partial [Streptococcus pyogenes]
IAGKSNQNTDFPFPVSSRPPSSSSLPPLLPLFPFSSPLSLSPSLLPSPLSPFPPFLPSLPSPFLSPLFFFPPPFSSPFSSL